MPIILERTLLHRKERPLHSDWIRIMALNGLENMISVPMNFLMEMAEDRKARRQKNFFLKFWQMEEWLRRKLQKKQKAEE